MPRKVDYMKLSQDATNEIWAVTLNRKYRTPGAKKRAIEKEVRGALETALGVPSTTDGWAKDDLDQWAPIFGGEPKVAKENPYAKLGAIP